MTDKMNIVPAEGTWVVRAGGAVLAESGEALELREEGHDPVVYFPRSHVATAFLDRSETVTTCPLKGEAVHFSIVTKSGTIKDAAWSYETPDRDAAAIVNHIAFYPDKTTIEEV